MRCGSSRAICSRSGRPNSKSEPQSAIAASDFHLALSHRAHAVTATALPPVPNRNCEYGSPFLSLYLWGAGARLGVRLF